MNENDQYAKPKIKKHNFVFIIWIILFVWALGATGFGLYFNCQYQKLKSSIENTGNGNLIEYIENQRNLIFSQQADLSAAGEYLRIADERADELERRTERAYELAQQSDAEFIEFRNTVAGFGSTISEAIRSQLRIIEIVDRVERNNTAVKMELRMRDGESSGR